MFFYRKLSRLDTEKTRIHRESFHNVVEKNVMNPQPIGREDSKKKAPHLEEAY